MTAFGRNIQTTYDRVAAEYAEHFFDELNHKPFDRDPYTFEYPSQWLYVLAQRG